MKSYHIVLLLVFLVSSSTSSTISYVLNDAELKTAKELAGVVFENYINGDNKLKSFCIYQTKILFDSQGWVAAEFYRNMRSAYRQNSMKGVFIDRLLQNLKKFQNKRGNCFTSFQDNVHLDKEVQISFRKAFKKTRKIELKKRRTNKVEEGTKDNIQSDKAQTKKTKKNETTDQTKESDNIGKDQREYHRAYKSSRKEKKRLELEGKNSTALVPDENVAKKVKGQKSIQNPRKVNSDSKSYNEDEE